MSFVGLGLIEPERRVEYTSVIRAIIIKEHDWVITIEKEKSIYATIVKEKPIESIVDTEQIIDSIVEKEKDIQGDVNG